MKRRKAFIGALALAAVLALVVGTADAAKKKGAGDVVAAIGDHEITLTDVDKAAREANMQAFQALYDARRGALDSLVNDHLLELEAKARGISTEELVSAEVTQKAPPVTDADVASYYEQNQARMRGQPLEKMAPDIKRFLTQQAVGGIENDFYAGLRKKHGVSIKLEPPRAEVSVAANDPRKGPDGAAIQIVEYSDFQ